MKTINILIITVIFNYLSINAGDCQSSQTEGSVRYVQTSDWVKMMTSLDYISQAQKDRITLMSSGRGNWEQYKTLHFSPKRSKYENSEEETQSQQGRRRWNQDDYFVCKDFESNKILVIQTILDRTYVIRDSINHPVWKIKNDIKQIAGHMCMNATYHDSIRDYDVEAWFALDIPVSTGPDRFTGLPGLILEVNINNGAMLLSADRIEFKDLEQELDFPEKTKGRQMNFAEYNSFIRKNIDEQIKAERPWFFVIPY